MSGGAHWDGTSYDCISTIQQGWGAEVLDRLQLEGALLALDAGCGTGRVTEMLLERMGPEGQVLAVDASPSMVEKARRLTVPESPYAGRVEVVLCDLLELEVQEPVDAIVSTATFHWVTDHDSLFARMRAALRRGGHMAAQCGGEGNIVKLRARARKVMERSPYAESFATFRPPWNYAGPAETEQRLLAAGFSRARCWLTPAPSEPAEPREYLRTIVLGPHVQHLPAALREPFMDEVMEELGEPVTIDYVRLNIDAWA